MSEYDVTGPPILLSIRADWIPELAGSHIGFQ